MCQHLGISCRMLKDKNVQLWNSPAFPLSHFCLCGLDMKDNISKTGKLNRFRGSTFHIRVIMSLTHLLLI